MRNRPPVKASRAAPKRSAVVDRPERRGTADGTYLGLTGPERNVFERLRAAIVEQVLPPGAKLAEEELASIYNMSRMRIRRVLLSLSHVRLVTLFAGRGAFVAKPTPSEARAVFQARRLIETAVIAEFDARASPALIKKLQRNVADARVAERDGDRPAAIRLSGAFHTELMAEIGNPTIGGILEELVSRSSLVIMLYQRSGAPVCRDDHHAELVEHLRQGNFPKAALLMRHHLTEIEAGLDLDERPEKSVDLRDVLRPAAAERTSEQGKSPVSRARTDLPGKQRSLTMPARAKRSAGSAQT